MGTRALISVETVDGECLTVFCARMGFVESTGDFLVNHYGDYDSAMELLQHGDILDLEPTLGKTRFLNNPTQRYPSYEALLDDYDAINYIEYFYVFSEGKWLVSFADVDGYVDVETLLSKL